MPGKRAHPTARGALCRHLKGTGKWWDGATWPATVVDVRESDGTVKVQYEVGATHRLVMLAQPDPGLSESVRSDWIQLFGAY